LPLAEPAAGAGEKQAGTKPEERAGPTPERLRKRLVRKTDGRYLILYQPRKDSPSR
jgi:hypothetical protein